MEEEDAGKQSQVQKPQADKTALKVHTTIPIDKSMAKLKAHRKPRKKAEVGKEGTQNESKNTAGRGNESRTPPDAGSGSGRSARGYIFPLDWFRK
jgi:hypothetical protein